MKANTSNFSDGEKIETRAAAWLAQRDSSWTEADEKAFSDWLAQDPRHPEAFNRLQSVWSELAVLKHYRPTTSIHPDPDLLVRSQRKSRDRSARRFNWISPLGALAALFAIALVALAARSKFQWRPAGDRFETPVGGFSRITLADGSVMEMNADSSARVVFGPAERRVFLDRGEAHFTVARDVSRPFWVASNGFGVRAVGTAFDVHRAAQGIEVLVTAGRVKLTALNQTDAASSPVVAAGWRAVLQASQKEGPQLEKISGAQMRSMLAWQSSRLSFVEMPLSEVVEEFNERNDLQIRLGSPDLDNLSVGGSFAADNVESFIRLFTSAGEIVADRSTPGVIVLRKAR